MTADTFGGSSVKFLYQSCTQIKNAQLDPIQIKWEDADKQYSQQIYFVQ